MIDMISMVFLIAAAVILISALLTVTAHNVVHALLYLVVTMLAIALIFFLLGASFAAALQIIIYAGAIMVLFVFVTMMLHQGEKSLNQERQLFQFKGSKGSIGAFLLSAVLLLELITVLGNFSSAQIINPASALEQSGFAIQVISVKQLGIQLYGPYRLLVVIAAMLLLSALISAIHIGRRQAPPPTSTPTPTPTPTPTAQENDA